MTHLPGEETARNRQWVWGRSHSSFRHLHALITKYRQQQSSHSTRRREPSESFQCLQSLVSASKIAAVNQGKKWGPPFFYLLTSTDLCQLLSFCHREEQLFTALAMYPHLEVQLCCLSLKKKKKNYYILTSHKSTEIQELKIQPFTPTHCNVTLYKSSTVLVVFFFLIWAEVVLVLESWFQSQTELMNPPVRAAVSQ